MTASTKQGKYGKLEISANGTTFSEILLVESLSLDGSSGTEKEAHWGNNGEAPEVPIDGSLKGSLSAFFDPTDAPTTELRTAWTDKATRKFKFYYNEDDTTHTAFDAYVTSFKEDINVSGLIKCTAELSIVLSTYTTGVSNT